MRRIVVAWACLILATGTASAGCSWLKTNGPALAVDVGSIAACVIGDFEAGVPFFNCVQMAEQMGVTLTPAQAQSIVSAHVATKSHVAPQPLPAPK